MASFASAIMPAFDDQRLADLECAPRLEQRRAFQRGICAAAPDTLPAASVGIANISGSIKNKRDSRSPSSLTVFMTIPKSGSTAASSADGRLASSSFQFDLTPYLKWDGIDNVVAVRVDHSRFADSRFYTGSGIYRNVRLVITGQLRISPWGVSVTNSNDQRRFCHHPNRDHVGKPICRTR